MRVLLIFIDGMGIGVDDKKLNPFVTAKTPFFDTLLERHDLLTNNQRRGGKNWCLNPATTTLGVLGTPQSATGQTTLLTGKNGAAFLGKHLRGFPNLALRQIIKAQNIYGKLKQRNYSCTFANVYRPDFFSKYIYQEKYHSVTTVAALTAEVPLRNIEDLLIGNGVFQDFTNKTLLDKYGLNVPIIEPEEAGSRLGKISQNYNFTLYEYFQTDVSGHKQNLSRIQEILNNLDYFLAGVINSIDLRNTVVIITSDHGNIEDISHKNHTENMVPTLLITENLQALAKEVNSIQDVTPLAMELVAI